MLLEVKNLSKDFGGLHALKDVTFSIESGEVVGLIGPNGSGKSTCFNMITGFLPPTSGTIFFDGMDITPLPAHRISQLGMARSFQLVRPFLELSTLDNVLAGSMFGSQPKRTRRQAMPHAMEVLARVGLENKANVKAADLTVMERKWLEVARALANEPKLLLLDEFMAGLRPSEIPNALDLIRAVNATGITVIVVEHIIKAITSTCERILVLNAGELLAEGPPEKIVRNELVIDAYLGHHHADG